MTTVEILTRYERDKRCLVKIMPAHHGNRWDFMVPGRMLSLVRLDFEIHTVREPMMVAESVRPPLTLWILRHLNQIGQL